MNFVWYRNVDAAHAFDELMTDRDGRSRPVSLPPGAARPEFVERLRADARSALAPVIAEVATGVAEPFVQAVFDIEVPRMAHGRVCLIGDAAFAVRPHAAAGTAKAAADGWELAAQLAAHGGDIEARAAGVGAPPARARAGFAQPQPRYRRRLPAAGHVHARGPPLIFGLRGPGR